MADEEALTTGMKHTHVYVVFYNNVRASTIKNRFPQNPHIEKCRGSDQENIDYILKQGKYLDSEKAESSIEGTFESRGECDVKEKEESIGNNESLLNLIRSGLSTDEIIQMNPKYIFKGRDIDYLRERVVSGIYRKKLRFELEVTYIYGTAGAGKTKSIFEAHNPEEICRITDYKKDGSVLFDSYRGNKILVFEEFNSQVKIESMLNYLDIYPLMLPARYDDHVACYTKVYITANKSLDSQYKNIQDEYPEQWRAFKRRIHNIVEFKEKEIIIHKGEWRKEN